MIFWCIYRSIKDHSDLQALQNDLNKLVQWSTIWQIPFILTKHLIFTDKLSFPLLCVNISWMTMKYGECRPLSILDFNLGTHKYLVKLILLRHSFEGTLDNVYKPLKLNAIRHASAPYANMLQSFGPNNNSSIRDDPKAVRFVFNNYSWHSSNTEILNNLDWKSLEKQRDESILAMFHKISLIIMPFILTPGDSINGYSSWKKECR